MPSALATRRVRSAARPPGSAVLSDEAFTSSATSAAILIGSRSLYSTSDAAADVSLFEERHEPLARFRRSAGDRDRRDARLRPARRQSHAPADPSR